MRFFTTVKKAGRIEYFLVSTAIGILGGLALFFVLQFQLVGVDGEALSEVQDITSVDSLSYDAGSLALFAIICCFVMYLNVINTLRRLKDLQMDSIWFFALFIPIIGFFFQLYLMFAPGGWDKGTYTPYGDNPYDPNSWVPPEAPSANGTGVSYQGQDIMLPGEDTWGQNDKAA